MICWRFSNLGLSPRLRGNLLDPDPDRIGGGSIPAPAGEPAQCGRPAGHDPVYPRACGGTDSVAIRSTPLVGLSPRLRGNQCLLPVSCRHRRSIPAPAGEPVEGSSAIGRSSVYPRACGGTQSTPAVEQSDTGLSPRLWGNPCLSCRTPTCVGSIPAPAGEPVAREP